LGDEIAMNVTAEQIVPWVHRLLGLSPRPSDLKVYLADIPRLESLGDVPSGTAVLVRGDVDAKPGAAVGEGDIRLRSMVETLKFGQSKGWKQIVFGHIGRKPEGSLDKVAKRLGELLGCQVSLLTNWLEDRQDGPVVSDATRAALDAAQPGSVLMLENTRAYPVETVLWKA
jgi:phosphoglycerate kinase